MRTALVRTTLMYYVFVSFQTTHLNYIEIVSICIWLKIAYLYFWYKVYWTPALTVTLPHRGAVMRMSSHGTVGHRRRVTAVTRLRWPTVHGIMGAVVVYLPSFYLSYHYNDVIMNAMVSQTTSLTNVYSTVYSGADQRKHQSSASLAFVRRIHQWPVNSPHKWPVTRKMFPFDDVIMTPT